MQGGHFKLMPSKAEQESALVDALSEVLWQARITNVAVLALPVPERGLNPKDIGYEQLMRCLVMVQATSKSSLQVLMPPPCH